MSRPSETQTGIQDFRLFDPEQAALAMLTVKDWTSLDDHSDLIRYEGQFDRSSKSVDLQHMPKTAA